MTDEFTYKTQDVHYLGFLEAQLRDMQGIQTLAYELIQNADDAPETADGRFNPGKLCFDVTDDALIVENDGVFRPEDFARLQTIASGGKREESGVIGAFGLGFLAVYQVTDRPEIFSNGRHWTIFPDAPAGQRIVERQVETNGTRFRLPWAFDSHTAVRRALRLSAIQPAHIDDIAAQLSAAIGPASLFLQQIHTLEVRRSGRVLRRITRHAPDENDRVLLQEANGETAVWLLFSGSFSAAAAQLRTQYAVQIEITRRSDVFLAVPVKDLAGPGGLFAGLPTASTLPLALYINADFFPTTDRRRIHFDEGYQAAWNQAAITCAAQTLADQLPSLALALGPTAFWRLVEQIDFTRQQAEQGDLPVVFAAFWHAIAPLLAQQPFLYTAQEAWALPGDVRLWTAVSPHRAPQLDQAKAGALLTALDIPIIHPQLAAYFPLLRRPEIGAPPLAVQDVTAALIRLGLDQPMPLYAAPPFLRQLDDWQTLWALLNDLLQDLVQPDAREAAFDDLGRCALVLTIDMQVQRLRRVYRGAAESQALFPAVAWLHPLVNAETFPGRFVPHFGVRQAVDLLAETPPEQLQADWQMGQLDLPRLFRWLEARPIEIFTDDRALPAQIRRLPLCPVDGELRPLTELYLPGGFTDPLRLAGLVDLTAVGGRRQFLEDLGVPELDFAAYIHDVVPRVLTANPDVPANARHALVILLAQRLGEFRDDDALQAIYGRLPLVACLDGSYRPAQTVYLTRDAMTLLGETIHIAEPAESKAIQALYRWLGVRQQPAPTDLVAALLTISRQFAGPTPLDAATLSRVQTIWRHLAELPPADPATADLLRPLQERPVIPNGRHSLTSPDRLILADQPELAARFRALPDPAAQDCLLDLPPNVAEITAVIGLRRLSQTAVLQVHTGGEPEPAVALTARMEERRPLIIRLLLAEMAGERTGSADWLDELQIFRAARLEVQVQLPLSTAKTLATAPEAAAAKLVRQTAVFYVCYAGEDVPWTAVARELALTLRPDRPPGALALGIKEILAAPTYAAAAQILAELGYN